MRLIRCASGRPGRPASPRLGRRFAALLLVAALPALALEPDRDVYQYVHRTWSLDDGLPQSSVNALLQDRDGYLWTATYGGLARFDGVRFRVFDVAAHPGLPSDRLLALTETPDGTLWAGSDGRGLVRLRDGRAQAVEPPDGTPLHTVHCLAVGPDGTLWIGTGDGVARRRPDGAWRLYGTADGLPAARVLSLLADREGDVWAGTEGGLARWSGDGFEPAGIPGLEGRYVFSVARGRDGELWAGTGRGRLVRWYQGVEERWELPGAPRLRALLEDRDGALWIGTDPGGLFRLYDGELERYLGGPDRPLNRVNALLEDREGNLWVGSSRSGLHQLRAGQAMAFGGPDTPPEHPLWPPVVPVLADGAGGVWAGLACGGLTHLDATGASVHYAEEAGFDNTCVWSLAPDGDGGLWVGTLGGGLYRFRAGRALWQRGPPIRSQGVHALHVAAGGTLYAGTESGLFRVEEEAAGVAYHRLPGTEDLRVLFVAPAPDGSLWLGTEDGVWVVPRRAGSEPGAARRLHPRLAGVPVRAIHFDAAGAAWLGTYGHGLLRWHDRAFTTLTTADGLPDDVVSSIFEDRRGRFWLTGNRGVTRVARQALEARAAGAPGELQAMLFTAGDGMPVTETNGGGQPAGALAGDGLLWVPTISGLARFDTTARPRSTRPPPVRVEEVWLDGEPVDPGGGLQLPAGARNLEIRYTALSFSDPKRVSFRYRLEGLDEAWTEAGSRRTAYYPFLPAGAHEFHVVARTEDGVWDPVGASLELAVAPRFVETPRAWMLGLLALGALAVGVAVLRQRLRETRVRLEQANEFLEKLATVDDLTGIANRRSLMRALDREWKRAVRHGRRLGFLMIDLDRFKLYNDHYGHLQGDDCLRRVAAELAGGLRRVDDLLARFGGEELAAVVPETDEEALTDLAERLRRRVETAAIPHAASAVRPVVTVSIGGAVMAPGLGDRPDDLLSAADRALYAAKAAGRNRVVVGAAAR